MVSRRLQNVLIVSLAAVLLGVVSAPVWPVERPLAFRTEINRQFGPTAPYTGALVFTVDKNGYIKGQYESDSIRPDPLYGQIVPVTGAISGTNAIRIQIGAGANPIIINGSYSVNGISGTVTNGLPGIWTFKAVRVHLRHTK